MANKNKISIYLVKDTFADDDKLILKPSSLCNMNRNLNSFFIKPINYQQRSSGTLRSF